MKRKWHHWEKWECVPAGMYAPTAPWNLGTKLSLRYYTAFLRDLKGFERALRRVLREWPVSCEQFLSNPSINRIAWLGQASMCIVTGVPACMRLGFFGLTLDEQKAANEMADKYLHKWRTRHDGGEPAEETYLPVPVGLHKRIAHYVETWKRRGYPKGIPDEVPSELMRLNLAPSNKAIALAILKNDHALSSLGYSQPVSPWYGVLKRLELSDREGMNT